MKEINATKFTASRDLIGKAAAAYLRESEACLARHKADVEHRIADTRLRIGSFIREASSQKKPGRLFRSFVTYEEAEALAVAKMNMLIRGLESERDGFVGAYGIRWPNRAVREFPFREEAKRLVLAAELSSDGFNIDIYLNSPEFRIVEWAKQNGHI